MNIKKGDSVVIISGESKDLGNAKKVLRAMPKENILIRTERVCEAIRQATS